MIECGRDIEDPNPSAKLSDRELIFMLFDMVAALSKRLYPDEEMRVIPDALSTTPNAAGLPLGSHYACWIAKSAFQRQFEAMAQP